MKLRKIIGAMATICVLAMAGCGKSDQAIETSVDKHTQTQEEEVVLQDCEYQTTYMDFTYPGKYYQDIVIDITEDENKIDVAFSGKSSVGDVFLFIVHMGSEVDESMGTIQTEYGDVNVSIELIPLSLDDRWQQKEKDSLEKLQEEMFQIITEQIKKAI